MTGARRVALAWLRPTRRAIDWTPLIVIAAAQLAVGTVLGWRYGEVPGLVQHLAAAGLAASVVLSLHDPARPLLQALPTPLLVRLSHRVVLLLGATAATTAVLVVIVNLQASSPAVQPGLPAALIALIAFGIAVHAAAGPVIDHASELAASAVLLWVGTAVAIPAELVPDAVRFAWLEHPWPTTAAAMGVTLLATTHRSA